jgi:hypothetical protein
MEKQIIVPLERSNGEYVTLPLIYKIENEDGNENIRLMNCRVNLPDGELPEWLSPTTFTIREVYSPGSFGSVGVTVTEFSSIRCKNVDSANLVGVVHHHINIKERLS